MTARSTCSSSDGAEKELTGENDMISIKKGAAILLSAVCTLGAAAASGCSGGVSYVYPDRVSVYETTGTKASLLGRKSSLSFTEFDEEDTSRQTVYVYTDKLYQEYEGYGASMTHASGALITEADEETRAALLDALFSRSGANFSLVRIPIGASDYIPGDEYFTCDDMPDGQTDKALEHFTLEHDGQLLSVLKQIKQINPDVTFMASPWSAPAWMKVNNSLVGGGYLKQDMHEAYADYIVRFVEEYAKQGIDISYVSIVNEPSVGALSYPTMDMTPAEAAELTTLVGGKLREKGLDTDIVGWDFNYGSSSGAFADAFFECLYEEGEAGKYSDTVAFHGYDGDGYLNPDTMSGLRTGIEKVVNEYGKAALVTEITESASSTDFAGNLTYAAENVVVNPCAVQTDEEDNSWNGCGGALYWNFVLDGDGGPTPAAHDDNPCSGVITLDKTVRQGSTTYRYTKSSAYYAMAQVSKFMYDVDGKPCRALRTQTEYVELSVMSYYRNDGAIITVVCNTSEFNDSSVDIVIGDKKISYEMMPQSIVTFVC